MSHPAAPEEDSAPIEPATPAPADLAERTREHGSVKARILVVADDPAVRRGLARQLLSRGLEVMTAEGGAAALPLLATTPVDVVLCDLAMEGIGGLELLRRIRAGHPGVLVVVMASFAELEAAEVALRSGAHGALLKPFPTPDAPSLAIERAVEHKRLVERVRSLEERLEEHERFGEVVGSSPIMQAVYRRALSAAASRATVLIEGEPGTGKEHLARAIHRHSRRAERPFWAVHCGAVPAAVVEAELFGDAPGAAPGAPDRGGLFLAADQATVFLDQVGDLSPSAQTSLLQVVAAGEVGSEAGATRVDVRVIAATDVDLRRRVADGRFREDLFHRLQVVLIELPPLRKRKSDIPLLSYHFLQKYNRRAGRDVRRIGIEAMRALREHDWPGNVRELQGAIEHAVVMARGDAIVPGDLPLSTPEAETTARRRALVPVELCDLPYATAKERALEAFERAYVERSMARTGANVAEAARQAGMDRSNFRRLLKKARGQP